MENKDPKLVKTPTCGNVLRRRRTLREDNPLPFASLEDLARVRFVNLSAAEERILRAVVKGETAYCGLTSNDADPANNPKHSKDWGHEREIRADLIRWLCADRSAVSKIAPAGLQVYAGKIMGSLDLSNLSLNFPLAMRHCRFNDDADLTYASLFRVDLGGTNTAFVDFGEANVLRDILLNDGFLAHGGVDLTGTKVGSGIDCSNGNFVRPGDFALSVEGAVIDGDLQLSSVFAEGEVTIMGAQIGGNFDCNGATFRNRGGDAISADGAVIKGDAQLCKGFKAEGQVRLPGADIVGDLDCSDASFCNPTDDALFGDDIRVGGNVFLRGQFTATGSVSLQSARVGGDLICTDGSFVSNSLSIAAEGIRVDGGISLDGKFCSRSGIQLRRAQILGALNCDGGTFGNLGPLSDTPALDLDGSAATDCFLRGCNVRGRASLFNVQIRGNLEFSGTHFSEPSRHKQADGTVQMESLTLERAEIGGYVYVRYGFQAEGLIDLRDCRVGSQLEFEDGKFTAVILRGAAIKGGLVWNHIKVANDTSLDLREATAAFLEDDELSWPMQGNLKLDGFSYSRISGGPVSAKTRIGWLGRQGEFRPQPYIQLARVLHDMGDDEGSREVRFEMASDARAADRRHIVRSPLRWLRLIEDSVSRETIGYGLYPARAVWYLLSMSVLGWLLFRRAARVGAMAPTDRDAYIAFRTKGAPPNHYPPFSALIYSLENCLPLVKFGQDDHWQPDPHFPSTSPSTTTSVDWKSWIKDLFWIRLPGWLVSPAALRWFRWIMIGLGWLLATFFVAGLSGIVEAR